MLNLGRMYARSETVKTNELFKAALDLAVKVKYAKGQINALNSLADEAWNNTNYEQAIKYYYKAYRVSDSIKDPKCVALSLYNLGWVSCILQHNYKEDKYLYKSLDISLKTNDLGGTLRAYNALGNYYYDRFSAQKQKIYFDSSIYYTQKGIDLSKKNKIYGPLAAFNVNMGDLFYNMKDYRSAIFYYSNAADGYKVKVDSFNMVFILSKIAQCNGEFRDSDEDIKTLNFARAYCKKNGALDLESDVLQMLSNLYYKRGKFKEGFDVFKEYIEKKKELDKKSYSTSMANLENNYSLEKSEASVTQLTQAKELEELRSKKKNYFIFGLTFIGIGVLVIAFLLFRQNKMRQQTNIQLLEQNNIIKEKKEEIDHSIQYAKGIQLAILPDINELNDQFKESFVLYKPKDVVSGDFYWFAKVEKDFYCLAADCTGHGVPGALMSIIGMDKIIQAIFEKKITEPNKILSYLNIQIKNVLKQHSDASKQKDGMDIAILKFNETNSEVEYSGANRPLFLIRNKEIIEYKANKTAIAGFTANDYEFSTHKISLQKNDGIYIFTDGYADQFGGPSGGKKVMTKKLKQMLISFTDLAAIEQKNSLETAFNEWKGSFEQTDDVLIVGIKI
ncbi:MAG: SpoIIE family protein phosphatase [Bacteroidetes bacterium]|nr:SpoIIE family protein phosphatase [Bacteroidota bacterium]